MLAIALTLFAVPRIAAGDGGSPSDLVQFQQEIETLKNSEAAERTRVERDEKHESDQLIAAGVEEDMTDAPALADVDDVAADRLEPEHALVKLACLVEVERRQPDMREALVRHGVTSCALFTYRPKQRARA